MERPEQQNCLAMLVFVSLLWATEVSSKTGQFDVCSVETGVAGHTFVCNVTAHSISSGDSAGCPLRSEAA